ncbi:WFDC2 isoform 5 [Pongo abelii]|uniref:WFDC2 isoform 5 n=1 Tax=Pongo abelii TaxID=9601 RepID=A0A2J8XVL0_PONAB|nr:WFDC2 isoform 5 [Pongo abelii]
MPACRLGPLAAALLLCLLLFGFTLVPDKEGSCPQVNINFPQLGLCQDQCQVDSQCPGQMKCCRNGCGNVSCVTPNF